MSEGKGGEGMGKQREGRGNLLAEVAILAQDLLCGSEGTRTHV